MLTKYVNMLFYNKLQNNMKNKKSFRGISTILALILKSKKLVVAVKALKAVKFLKPLITMGSMLLSLMVYGWVYGWVFGIGLVAMIFIHEIGHVIALKQKGYPFSAPIFIPLLGAVIFAPSKMERDTEAYVGIGGPVLGTIGALSAYLIWYLDPGHSMFWLIMSYVGIFINLFNMIPIRPLDGGRVTQAVGPWFKWVGIVILLILTLAMKDPGLLLIWILVIDDMTNIPIKQRSIMVVLVLISMFICLIAGIGPSFWVLLFDFIIAFVFGFFIIIRGLSKDNDELKRVEDEIAERSGLNRPELDQSTRNAWLIKYLLLTFGLIFILYQQQKSITPWLEEMKKQNEKSEVPSPQISENIKTYSSWNRFFYMLNGNMCMVYYVHISS